MIHNSSEHMYAMEEMKTPDYKAKVVSDQLEAILKAGPMVNFPQIVRLRDQLVEVIDQVTSEDDKVRYHKLIIDCDTFIPQECRSEEIK